MNFSDFDKSLHQTVSSIEFRKTFKVDKHYTCIFNSRPGKSLINMWGNTVKVTYLGTKCDLNIKKGIYYIIHPKTDKIVNGKIECSTSQETSLDNPFKKLNLFGSRSDIKYLRSL